MTGPLTLSGDPVAPGQAATKRYADLGFAGKADLVAGLVPGGELGTGTANNTVCLHGDSTWGGCGSSSKSSTTTSCARGRADLRGGLSSGCRPCRRAGPP